MNKIPGFTAEASLYKSSGYHINRTDFSFTGQVVPQLINAQCSCGSGYCCCAFCIDDPRPLSEVGVVR